MRIDDQHFALQSGASFMPSPSRTSSVNGGSPQRSSSALDVAAHGFSGVAAVGAGAALQREEQCEALRRASEELRFRRKLRSAHDKGVQALKMATEIYGQSSLRLVPFYLVLAEIALLEQQLKQAEEMLSLVNWQLVKDQSLSGTGSSSSSGSTGALPASTANTMGAPRSGEPFASPAAPSELPEELKNLYVVRMNKLYSTLLLEYEVYPEALQRAAHGAYHCSLLFGPEHLYTSELYFCLGQIFNRMQKQPQQHQQQQQRDGDSALGMFDKVVDIWYRFLTNPPEATAAWMLEHQRLRIQEATVMLQAIIVTRTDALGATHVATGEATYTQGLLALYLGDHAQAMALMRQAKDIYALNLGDEHPSTVDVTNVLQQLDEAGV